MAQRRGVGSSEWRAWAWVVLPLLAACVGPRVAAACPPLFWDLEFMVPPPAGGPMPRDGALLVKIAGPNGWEDEVTLTTTDGVAVPLEVIVQYYSAHELALVEAHALEPLEPNTEYVWSVGPSQHTMVTGEGFDLAIPTPGEPVGTFVGTTLPTGCLGVQYDQYEYDIAVPGLLEPVVLVGQRAGWIDVGLDSPLRALAWHDQEICVEVRAFDYGGHWATVGTVCMHPELEDESSSGAEGTISSGDTGGETTPPQVSTTETGDGTPAHDDGVTHRGCACQHSPQPQTAAGLLLLLAVGRRRSHKESHREPSTSASAPTHQPTSARRTTGT